MPSAAHPRHDLVPQFNSPVRLSIIAALSSVDEMDFPNLRDLIEVSDAVLSKQLSTLEAEKYVVIRKTFVGKRPKTWISASPRGSAAFARHVGALRRVAATDLGGAGPAD
jgi:DNA-binding HxlR family transcriptional regulator